MNALCNLLPSSTSDSPQELKIKIFSCLPVKILAISRLVSPIWRTFIDTHFTEVSSRQFLFILQKYPIADQNQKNYLSRYAVKKIVADDFEKALELENNLEGSYLVERTLEDLVKNADSKEKLLKLFGHFINREKQLGYDFVESIEPLITRYFSFHAALKKEKQEAIDDNFNEALSVLKKIKTNQEAKLLIGLYLVKTYPECIKNQQQAVFDSLQLEDAFLYYVCDRNRKVVEKFSFSTFLNFLVIAKLFPEKDQIIPFLLNMITTREDALAFLHIGGSKVQEYIQRREIYEHLNFFDLLNAASLLPEETDTYQIYRKILERAESAGEFEIGLRKLLERKPKQENLKEYFRVIVPIILNETPTDHFSFGVYEMLVDYHGSIMCAETFVSIASKCDIGICMRILDSVKRMQNLNDNVRKHIMKLEIEMGKFEQAKQTFCSIKDPEAKARAGAQLSFFIEKEDWDHFDTFFKELHLFNQDSNIFSELIGQMANKDVTRALNLVKGYWTGYPLAYCLTIIAKEQKKKKADFLPLVFEARTLIISLVTLNENEDASRALNLLKDLLELQSDES